VVSRDLLAALAVLIDHLFFEKLSGHVHKRGIFVEKDPSGANKKFFIADQIPVNRELLSPFCARKIDSSELAAKKFFRFAPVSDKIRFYLGAILTSHPMQTICWQIDQFDGEGV
jgi:hypothetical protein